MVFINRPANYDHCQFCGAVIPEGDKFCDQLCEKDAHGGEDEELD